MEESPIVVDLEAMGLAPLQRLGVRKFTRARRARPSLHRHEGAMEICYLESGSQTLTVGGRNHLLHGNTVFVTQPGELHGAANLSFERCRLYFLSLAPPRAGHGCPLAAPGEEKMLSDSLRRLPRTFCGDSRMKGLLDEMLGASAQSDPLWRTRLLSAVQRFLLLVLERGGGGKAEWFSPGVRRAVRYVGSHLDAPLDVGTLADAAGLSVPRLHALFRRETGMPPRDYVLRQKVEEAKRRLAGGPRSVTEIGFDLGFSSSQYFATVFRRYTGLSPTEYRNSVLNNPPPRAPLLRWGRAST